MARKSVKLAWIPNETARRSTMRKRRQSLMKKVKELSILCGLQTFCAVCCPYDPEPVVLWPPTREEAEKILARFLSLPAAEQTKKMTNQESYLRGRLTKLQDAHRNKQKVINELELAHLMDQVHHTGSGLQGFDLSGLNRFSFLLEGKLREIRKKAEYFEVELSSGSSSLNIVGNTNVVVPENPNLFWQEDFIMGTVVNRDGGGDSHGDEDLFDVVRGSF